MGALAVAQRREDPEERDLGHIFGSGLCGAAQLPSGDRDGEGPVPVVEGGEGARRAVADGLEQGGLVARFVAEVDDEEGRALFASLASHAKPVMMFECQNELWLTTPPAA